MLANWPDGKIKKDKDNKDVENLIEIISEIRSFKNELNISPGSFIDISLSKLSKKNRDFLNKNETVLKKLTERMFYQNWNNYYTYHIEKVESPPKFEMERFWVNYQYQHEFNPSHDHSGHFSFVVFMKIPTHWEEQHALPISINSTQPAASDFEFLLGHGNGIVQSFPVPLCPEDEGRMLFFPAWLRHQVYPFYECEEERITISGNIRLREELNNNQKEER